MKSFKNDIENLFKEEFTISVATDRELNDLLSKILSIEQENNRYLKTLYLASKKQVNNSGGIVYGNEIIYYK